jgi:N-acetylglucosaminyldiphosphoundecaprenol N-acetyl-beta-D-mannosaminyltransferase
VSFCPPTVPRINVLGIGISALNLPLAVDVIDQALREKKKGYVCVTGAHGVMEAQRFAELKRILNASFLTTPDGMPMVWMGKLQGARHMSRVYGPDLMLEVLRMSVERGYKHFFYGGTNGVAEELRRVVVDRFPGLQVVGTYEPPFRPLNDIEERDLAAQIAQCKPDVMWVGISTPKQERFIAEYLPKLEATLLVAVGAAFNFHCGRVPQAPRWIQHSGLEWLYRCLREPRLWKRYGVVVPAFLCRATAQLLGLKRYKLEVPLADAGGRAFN